MKWFIMITLGLTVFAAIMSALDEHDQERAIMFGATTYVAIMMWGYGIEFRKIRISLEEVRDMLKSLKVSE